MVSSFFVNLIIEGPKMKTEQNLGDTGFELNCRGFFPRKSLKIQMRSNDFHLIVVMVGR